jgi:hypothetical protein
VIFKIVFDRDSCVPKNCQQERTMKCISSTGPTSSAREPAENAGKMATDAPHFQQIANAGGEKTLATNSAIEQGMAGLMALKDLLLKAAVAIEAIVEAEPAINEPLSRPIDDPMCRAKKRFVPTVWPRALDRNVTPTASTLFDGANFLDVYRPGAAIEIYAGAGAQRIGRTLLVPNYKIGTANLGQLVERFKQHKKEKYASCWHQNGAYVQDRDFHDWFPSYITTTLCLSKNSPVRTTARSIVVALPETMSPLDFEMALRAKLDHCAVHKWLMTIEGVTHCRALNLDPAIGQRSTAYEWGASTRLTPADELYMLRPNADGDALLVIAEQIVLEHLRLLQARGAGGRA